MAFRFEDHWAVPGPGRVDLPGGGVLGHAGYRCRGAEKVCGREVPVQVL